MNISGVQAVMVSAEVSPLAKAGGLADVVPALAGALSRLGVEVSIIMPKYDLIGEEENGLEKMKDKVTVDTGEDKEEVIVWRTTLNSSGVRVFLLENNKYFGGGKIYRGNEPKRFLFFSRATLEVLSQWGDAPDIIHCHDFHTALIPGLIKLRKDDLFKNTSTIYTIHNLNYQGETEIDSLSWGELSEERIRSWSRDPERGEINFMAQGIIHADHITTVSPTYAEEITSAPQGSDLEKVIKEHKDKLTGIVNGIDVENYDPSTDPNIHYNYDSQGLEKKKKNKLELQKEAGLPQRGGVPLIGFVSRLVRQKGVDLIAEELMDLDAQFLILGTGAKKYEKHVKDLAGNFPEKVSAQIMFGEGLARRIYAGSDIYLLPSRFEPCGLGQMIAMRYGTVPVVRSTGGLRDTVDEEVGFSFQEFNTAGLKECLKQALNVYSTKERAWERMQLAGMERDLSWDNSARQYKKIYEEVANNDSGTFY